MSIILPYKNLKEDENIKFISPKGEFLRDSSIHEDIAVSYLIGGRENVRNFMSGSDIFARNLSSEQCQKLRNWINERINRDAYRYMWADFMVTELKFDRTNTTQSDMYECSKWPTTACSVPFERFYNYYLMDESVDFIGLGVLKADETNEALIGLDYLLETKIITASEFKKNQDLFEEIKILKRSFPQKEDRIKFFK